MTSPSLHLPPINVLVWDDPQWSSHLADGFALRCFQRLSKPDEYYHHYAMVNVERTDRVLEGLHFVLIDLKKFTPKTVGEKKKVVL